jgi:hypothetical protein
MIMLAYVQINLSAWGWEGSKYKKGAREMRTNFVKITYMKATATL